MKVMKFGGTSVGSPERQRGNQQLGEEIHAARGGSLLY